MRLEHSFAIPVPVEQAWKVLLDVERVAPCMPGATLTEFTGESFAGTVRVKLGPVSLTYTGSGRFASVDESARRVVIEAAGRDSRSAGTAAATVTAGLRPDDAGTRVEVVTELQVTGRPAQFGRGMIADVGRRLIGQFADCLAQRLAEELPTAVASEGPAAGRAPEGEEAMRQPAAAGGFTAEYLEERPAAAEAEPIDLFAVTGAADALRRYAPYILGFAAGAALMWLLTRRRHT